MQIREKSRESDVTVIDQFWRQNRDIFLNRAVAHANGRRDLAESFLSDTILKLLVYMRGDNQPIENLRAFAFVCLRNSAVDHWRRSRREINTYDFDADIGAVAQPQVDTVDMVISRQELSNALFRLQLISPAGRQIIEMRIFEGKSYEEISEALGISQALARKRLQLARKKLAKLCQDGSLMSPRSQQRAYPVFSSTD